MLDFLISLGVGLGVVLTLFLYFVAIPWLFAFLLMRKEDEPSWFKRSVRGDAMAAWGAIHISLCFIFMLGHFLSEILGFV